MGSSSCFPRSGGHRHGPCGLCSQPRPSAEGLRARKGACSRVSAASGVNCRDLALKTPLEAENALLAWGNCSGCKGLGQVGSVFDSPFHLSGKRTEQSRCKF